MRLPRFAAIPVAALALAPLPAQAQFVDDEFNGTTLGSHWTVRDSTPAGSTITLTGAGSLRMTAKEGSDFWMLVNDECSVEQPAPTGSNWEVVTKIDNFDPRATGYKRSWNRTGIELWQDNDHWLAIGILGNGDGSDVGVQAFWQTDPVANRSTPDYEGASEYWPVTTSPLYLKIQKTDKGYLAQMSGDGTSWTNVLPVVRNPETPDGFFTAEKIRLYQSGGPVGGTGVSHPADFDYVRASSIAPPPSGCKEDEFTGTGLDTSIWNYYEGVMAGTLSVGGGNLTLTSGNFQDQWVFVEKAMHVYQDAPTSTSYAVVTKVGPNNLIPFEQWNAYGIALWQDQSNWVMIGNQRSEFNTNRVEVTFKRNGLYDAFYADFGTGALPGYLRIEQNVMTYVPMYSYDGSTWTAVPVGGTVYPAPLKNTQVRLFSKSVFANGTKANATFDWFRVEAAQTPAQDWQLFE